MLTPEMGISRQRLVKDQISTLALIWATIFLIESCTSNIPKLQNSEELLVCSSSSVAPFVEANNIIRITKSQKSRGIVLIAHGLNLLPSKMDELGEFLNEEEGMTILRLSLSGHRGDLSEMKSASALIWEEEFFQAYCLGKKMSEEEGVPYFFLGYSFGVPLGLKVLGKLKSEERKFKSMVLLAPALTLRWYVGLVKFFYLFGDEFVLPSKNLATYKANNGSSMAAYRSVFKIINELLNRPIKIHNVNSLVIINPKDEIVDAFELQKFISEQALFNWKILLTNQENREVPPHLIIDEYSLGKSEWERIKVEVKSTFSK